MADYKTKDDILRQKLNRPLLKRIIVRFDYSSIADMQKVLNKMVNYLKPPKGIFNNFDQMVLTNDTTQEDGTTIQGKDKITQVVYRFSECSIKPKQDVILDFARNNLCLDIHCNEQYEKIDEYLEMMSKLMSYIIRNEDFVQLNRIGLRKIDGVDGIDAKEADSTFEYFSQRLNWSKKDQMLSQQYTDQMLCNDLPAFVIYNRIVRYNPESNNLRFTLDIDCYKESSQIERRPQKEWLDSALKAMNDKLFLLFKMGIKLEYFNKYL
jgi:uncharacterized protein (TIGR04255 family)